MFIFSEKIVYKMISHSLIMVHLGNGSGENLEVGLIVYSIHISFFKQIRTYFLTGK